MAQSSTIMGFVHRRRRGAELFLVVLALVVGIGAYAAVGLGVDEEVPADLFGYGAWLAGLTIAAHLVIRVVAPYADPVLLPVVVPSTGSGSRSSTASTWRRRRRGRPTPSRSSS